MRILKYLIITACVCYYSYETNIVNEEIFISREKSKFLIDSFTKVNNDTSRLNRIRMMSFNTFVKLRDSSNLESILSTGLDLILINRYSTALDFIQQYINSHPNEAIGYYVLGLSIGIYSPNNLDSAILNTRKSVYLDTLNYEYRQRLANLYLYNSQFDSTLLHLNVFIKNFPNNENIIFQRGCIYISLKEYRKAIKDFNSIKSFKLKNVRYYNYKANLYSSLGDFSMAISVIDSSLKLNKKQPNLYAQKAALLSNLKKYKETYYTLKMGAELGCLECDTSLKYFKDYK